MDLWVREKVVNGVTNAVALMGHLFFLVSSVVAMSLQACTHACSHVCINHWCAVVTFTLRTMFRLFTELRSQSTLCHWTLHRHSNHDQGRGRDRGSEAVWLPSKQWWSLSNLWLPSKQWWPWSSSNLMTSLTDLSRNYLVLNCYTCIDEVQLMRKITSMSTRPAPSPAENCLWMAWISYYVRSTGYEWVKIAVPVSWILPSVPEEVELNMQVIIWSVVVNIPQVPISIHEEVTQSIPGEIVVNMPE